MAKNLQALCVERETLERLPVAGATWQVWTADETETAAAAAFERRYRQAPEHVVDHGGYLWLGPVPGMEGG